MRRSARWSRVAGRPPTTVPARRIRRCWMTPTARPSAATTAPWASATVCSSALSSTVSTVVTSGPAIGTAGWRTWRAISQPMSAPSHARANGTTRSCAVRSAGWVAETTAAQPCVNPSKNVRAACGVGPPLTRMPATTKPTTASATSSPISSRRHAPSTLTAPATSAPTAATAMNAQLSNTAWNPAVAAVAAIARRTARVACAAASRRAMRCRGVDVRRSGCGCGCSRCRLPPPARRRGEVSDERELSGAPLIASSDPRDRSARRHRATRRFQVPTNVVRSAQRMVRAPGTAGTVARVVGAAVGHHDPGVAPGVRHRAQHLVGRGPRRDHQDRRRRRLAVQRLGHADEQRLRSASGVDSVNRSSASSWSANGVVPPVIHVAPIAVATGSRWCSSDTVTEEATSTAVSNSAPAQCGGVAVDHDGDVRTTGVHVVAHHHLTGAGAGHPVHVPRIVAVLVRAARRGRRCRRRGSRRPSGPRGPWRTRPTGRAPAATGDGPTAPATQCAPPRG